MYVSNESPTLVDVYFDDVVMTHTKSNVIQYNEYYPFGLQTANSWTRDNSTNNFLYNAGSELNKTTSNYEMFFRDYDPALGRMNQTDPMASKYSSLTPYNYAFNDPVTYNDPMGDDPSDRDYSRFLYFDAPQQHHDASAGMYGSFTRYGPGNSILMAQLNQMWADAKAVTPDNIANYAARYGQTFGGGLEGLQAALSTLMPNQIYNPWAGRETASGGHAGAWQPYSSTIRKLVEERGYKLRTRYKQQKQAQQGGLQEQLTQELVDKLFGDSFKNDMVLGENSAMRRSKTGERSGLNPETRQGIISTLLGTTDQMLYEKGGTRLLRVVGIDIYQNDSALNGTFNPRGIVPGTYETIFTSPALDPFRSIFVNPGRPDNRSFGIINADGTQFRIIFSFQETTLN